MQHYNLTTDNPVEYHVAIKFIPEALAVSGHTREQTLKFEEPQKVMCDFSEWLLSIAFSISNMLSNIYSDG